MRRYLSNFTITALPPVAALLLAWWGNLYQDSYTRTHELHQVRVHSSYAMQEMFNNMGFVWPLTSGPTVPRVAVASLPGDLGTITDLELRKSLFIRALLPSILAENHRLRMTRERVETLLKDGLSETAKSSSSWLGGIMRTYRVDGDPEQPAVQRRLLRRLDEIPPALVIAQAANESGWGTSRFAVKGNNLFGIWTFKQEQGLIPEARADDMEHSVRTFPDIRTSVKAYLYTLNIGYAYRDLRSLRERMRQNHQPLDAAALAEGLVHYSQRGGEYVNELQAIIERNQLEFLESVDLHPVDVELVENFGVFTESTNG
jgi:Bax protein